MTFRVDRRRSERPVRDSSPRKAVKRTTEAIERDVAALINRGNDLRRESAELSRTAEELLRKVARLKGILAKQKRPAIEKGTA
jgi:hypothetical protein